MFSWSKKSGSSSQQSSSYPANRLSTNNASSSSQSPVAQTIQGSIRPPSSSSSSSSHQAPWTRDQHLQSYLTDPTLKPSTRKVSKDDSTYDTVFQTTAGDALILRVYVPPTSSSSNVYNNATTGRSVQQQQQQRCPVMTLVGVSARHAWIDSRMKVKADGFPLLTSDDVWNSSGMTLGEAVNAVVREFQLRPPHILQITDEGLQKIQQSLTTTQSTTTTTTTTNHHQDTSSPPDYDSLVGMNSSTPLPDVSLPDIPHFFTELDSMDRDELESLLTDELEFIVLRNKLPVYQQMDQQASTILQDNVTLAHQNMEKQQQLHDLHNQVQEYHQILQTKVQQFQILEQQQLTKCAPPTQDNYALVIKQLQKGRKTSLDETEEMASEWIDDGGDMDAFLKQFLTKRTIHHSRAAKLERLQQQQQH